MRTDATGPEEPALSGGWRESLTEDERQVFEACGYGQRIGFGDRPVVLVIDVNRNFLGDRPEPVGESVKRFPYSCGLAGWEALPHVASVVGAARAAGVPVAYCTGRWGAEGFSAGILGEVSGRHGEVARQSEEGAAIAVEVAPLEGDILIDKHFPSMFFGTPLASYLHYLLVDTVLLTGCTTSGCVRATAVDAYSYNFRPVVVEECVFDRAESVHRSALLDLDLKYADVAHLEEVLAYLERAGRPEASPSPTGGDVR